MKKIQNFNKIKKNITKITLTLVLIIVFISLILFMVSLMSQKESSLQDVGFAFDTSHSKVNRRFKVESKKEGIYNIGEYVVNLNSRKHLILNLSVKCKDNSFHTLLKNQILIQNAVLDTFSTYNSMDLPYSSYGHDRIKNKIKEHILNVFEEPIIEEVYFNKFIIQKIPNLSL